MAEVNKSEIIIFNYNSIKQFLFGEGWFISLRFLAILGALIGFSSARFFREDFDGKSAFLILLFVAFNLSFILLAFFRRKKMQLLLMLNFITDLLLIFLFVFITGSPTSHYVFLFYFIIPLSTYYFHFKTGLIITAAYAAVHEILCLLNPQALGSFLDMSGQIFSVLILGIAVGILAEKDRRDKMNIKQLDINRVNLEKRLAQSEKLSALGKMVSGLAHEIGSPLCVIGGYAERLAARLESDDPRRIDAEKIKNQLDRITKLVKQLLVFARHSPPQLKQIKVNGIIRSVVDMLAKELRKDQVEVVLALEDHLPIIEADPDKLYQVFFHMIRNADQAMEERGGKLTISSSLSDGPKNEEAVSVNDGRFIEIVIADTGCGIHPDHSKRIFEPFFTTKDVGDGTGLGLAICHGIVRDHGGWIEVESQPGEGSSFKIMIPANYHKNRSVESKQMCHSW